MRLLVFSIAVLLNSSINCCTLLSVRLGNSFHLGFRFGFGNIGAECYHSVV